jgi:hypothetical protein
MQWISAFSRWHHNSQADINVITLESPMLHHGCSCRRYSTGGSDHCLGSDQFPLSFSGTETHRHWHHQARGMSTRIPRQQSRPREGWCTLKKQMFLVMIFSISDSLPSYPKSYLLTPSRPHMRVLSGFPYMYLDRSRIARLGFIKLFFHFSYIFVHFPSLFLWF